MNKRQKTVILMAILVFIPLFAYFSARIPVPSDSPGVAPDRQCTPDTSLVCQFELDGQQVIVKFSDEIQVEEQNSVEIVWPFSYTLQSAWIQGINMYMGKTPLISESVNQQQQDSESTMMFFLGACSEPNMRWQLVLNLLPVSPLHSSSAEAQTFYVNFTTRLD